MTNVPRPRTDAVDQADVKRLGRLRVALDEVVRELRVWVDLLRNKALALRAVTAVPHQTNRRYGSTPDPLAPGSLDPRSLATALAAEGSPPRQGRRTPTPRLVGDDTEDVLRAARELWDTVADPRDIQASRQLADEADRVADRLEDRWRDARDQLRSVSQALERATGAPDDR